VVALTSLLLMSLLVSCASYTVKTDFDPEADFAAYRSFFVEENNPLAQRNPLVYKRVKLAIKETLVEKGLSPADQSQADLLIAVHGSKQEVLDVSTRRVGYNWQEIDVQQYTEGSLIIDFVDQHSGELVWRGMGSGVLSDDPGRDEDKVRKFIGDVLKDFPPGASAP
jgi:hypothetical protein